MHRRFIRFVVVVAVSCGVLAACDERGELLDTTLVTVDPTGQPAVPPTSPSAWSEVTTNHMPELSSGGRYVAFITSSDMDPADANSVRDCYVYDRDTAVSEWVSIGTLGAGGSTDVVAPTINANGRYVVFSTESALNSGDPTSGWNVYRRDRWTSTTTLVATDPVVTRRTTISSDGLRVAWASDDVYTVELVGPQPWTAELVAADGYEPRLDATGRYLGFSSTAGDVGLGIPAGRRYPYIADLNTAPPFTRVCLGRDSAGDLVNKNVTFQDISADATTLTVYTTAHLTLTSDSGLFSITDWADPMPDIVHETQNISPSYPARLSGDGRYIVFRGSNGGGAVIDRNNGTRHAASRTVAGATVTDGFALTISTDGEWVVFGTQDPERAIGPNVFGSIPRRGGLILLARQ